MSKLSDFVRATPTGKKAFCDSVLDFSLNEKFTEMPTLYLTEYKVGLAVSARSFIKNEEKTHIDHIVDDCRKIIIDEVFGEFRKPLMEAKYLIVSRRHEEAANKISEIFSSMFGYQP